jgi:hypothetical protein
MPLAGPAGAGQSPRLRRVVQVMTRETEQGMTGISPQNSPSGLLWGKGWHGGWGRGPLGART